MHNASEALLPSSKEAFWKPSEQTKRFVSLLLLCALFVFLISPNHAVGTFFSKSESGEVSVGPSNTAKAKPAGAKKAAPAPTFSWEMIPPGPCPSCGPCLREDCKEVGKVACWLRSGTCPPGVCHPKLPNVVFGRGVPEQYCGPRPLAPAQQCDPSPDCPIDLKVETVSQGYNDWSSGKKVPVPPPGNKEDHTHNCWLAALLTARQTLVRDGLINSNPKGLTMDQAMANIKKTNKNYESSTGFKLARIDFGAKEVGLTGVYSKYKRFNDYKSQIGACIAYGFPIIAGIGDAEENIGHYVVISGADSNVNPTTMLVNDPWAADVGEEAFGRAITDSATGLGCIACAAIRDGTLQQGWKVQQLFFPKWFNPDTGGKVEAKSAPKKAHKK